MSSFDEDLRSITKLQLVSDMKMFFVKIINHTAEDEDYEMLSKIMSELQRRHKEVKHIYARDDYETDNVGRDLYGC